MTQCDNSAFIQNCTLLRSPPNPDDLLYETYRARKVASEEVKVPETLDLRPYMLPVRNQGGRGTCAAFSAAACKEYQEHLDNNVFKEYISPESVYFQRAEPKGDGMYGRNVMEILSQSGVCRETLFPYDGSKEASAMPEEAKTELPNYKIKSFALVQTIDGVKKALFESGPCLICLPVYANGLAEFWKVVGDSKYSGGHAVVIVGYNKKGFILRNSWGKDWNGDGHVIFAYEDFGKQWEIWSMVDEETAYLPPHLDPNNPAFRGGCLCGLLRIAIRARA